MKSMAAKYMQLKKRNKDIEKQLGTDIPSKETDTTAIEHHMQDILNEKAINNVLIDGISPKIKTNELEVKFHEKFQHVKVCMVHVVN